MFYRKTNSVILPVPVPVLLHETVYSFYRHLGTGLRCGAVRSRSKAVVRDLVLSVRRCARPPSTALDRPLRRNQPTRLGGQTDPELISMLLGRQVACSTQSTSNVATNAALQTLTDK